MADRAILNLLSCIVGLSQRQDGYQSSQDNDEATDPDPHDQRTYQHFERRLIFVQLAEAGKNQVNVVAYAAAMHGTAHRRLLRRKEFEGGR